MRPTWERPESYDLGALRSQYFMDTYFLPPDKITIERREGGLVLNMDGQSIRVGPPRRALPLTGPDTYIVLNDEEGNELGTITDVAQLEPESREIMRDVLARAYVLTRITRVLEVDKEPLTGQTRWRVEIAVDDNLVEAGVADDSESANTSTETPEADESSNGQPGRLRKVGRILRLNRDSKDQERFDDSINAEEREFMINGQEDVQTARYPHIYIVDNDRNRYEIVDCETLDSDSRKAAERFF